MAESKNNVDVNNELKPCRRCQKIAQSGLKCVTCGTLSHIGCLKLLKGVKYLLNNNVMCCDEFQTNMGDEPDKFFNSASDLIIEDAKTMEIRYLKTIMEKNYLLIMNQQLTISSLQEQIKLMQISNKNQPMPSTSKRRNNLKADNTIPINSDTAIERNRNHLRHIVSGTEKTQTTDLFSDAAKKDMLRSDQDKDQVKTIEPKQGNSQLIKTADVAASILQEQSKLKMNHLIHLAEVPSTAGEEDMDSRNREDWRTVLPRRNRNKNKNRTNDHW
ncbi:hypothetical protein JTB14_003437 [Gonioctena quinquepunctata]|nr:hypothetical protein JTB14_003437 [Gonioctena quinquepunctata]